MGWYWVLPDALINSYITLMLINKSNNIQLIRNKNNKLTKNVRHSKSDICEK